MDKLKLDVVAPKAKNSTWVQTERESHEAWAALIGKSPKAAQLMHLLTARINENNAVVVSLPTLAKLLKCSRPTAIRAINILKDGNWLQSIQIGGSGSVNAYIINDRVAWTQSRDKLRYSNFSATVIVSSDEQLDQDELDNLKPLRKLPKIGELQFPYGDGLPPPSQPSLPDFEHDLPATGQDDIEEEAITKEEAIAKMKKLHEEIIALRSPTYKDLGDDAVRKILNKGDIDDI